MFGTCYADELLPAYPTPKTVKQVQLTLIKELEFPIPDRFHASYVFDVSVCQEKPYTILKWIFWQEIEPFLAIFLKCTNFVYFVSYQKLSKIHFYLFYPCLMTSFSVDYHVCG